MDIKRISVLEHQPYQPSVLGYVDALPTTGNTEGDRYILSTDQTINTWYDDAWISDTPEEGWRCTVLNDGEPFDLKFTNGAWVIVEDVFDSEELPTEILPTEEIVTEEFEQVQSDWEEEDTLLPSYIKNKPTIPTTGGFGVMSVTGDGVDNNDPANPVISYPDLTPYLTEVNWGDIGEVLSSQTDLQEALDLKENAFLESTASKFFSWDKTWRSIDYSYLINTPDLTSLGYWVPWDFGIRSDNGLISIRDDSGAHEMILGYDYHGGDYALSIISGLNSKIISGYDSVSEEYKYGGSFSSPYISLSDSKLVVNQVSSESQLRTWYIANPEYADDLENTPSAHILLYDDDIIAYRAVSHEFENPYASQGTVWISGDLDLQLSGRDRTTSLSYVLGTDGTRVIERTVANFISDNSLLSATLVNKGDILVYDGTSLVRFPKGEDGQVLYCDSGEDQGLIWDWSQSAYWGKNANNVVYTLSDGDSIGIKVGTTVYQALAMPNSSSFVLGNGGGNMTGINNTIIGNGAAPNITSGYQNIIAGTNAGNDLTTGYQNVLLGYLAGGNIVSGYGNMAFGTTALWKATGNNNVGIGAGSGFSLVTGSNNIYIGDATGKAVDSRMFYVANIVEANMSLNTHERYFKILDANVIATAFNGVALTNEGSSSKFLAENGVYYTVSGGGMTNPMTTTGDIIYQNSSGNPARLGATTNGYILSLVSGIPAWVAPSVQSHGNHTGEITSSGLVTTLDKTSISNRTALGSLAVDDYLLVYDTSGSNIYKSRIDTLIKNTPTNGQTQYGISSNWAYGHSNTFGNEAHVPAEPSTDATLKYLRGDGVWAIPAGGSGGGMVNPMTQAGDMIYYGSSNPSRLGRGTSAQIMQVVSGYPKWNTMIGEGTINSLGSFSITKEAVMNRTTFNPGDNTYMLGATTYGYSKFTVASLASYILPLTDKGDFIIANESGNAERFPRNEVQTGKRVITQISSYEGSWVINTSWTDFRLKELVDVPTWTGNGGKILGLNAGGTGLIWVSPSTNSVTLTGAVIGSGTGTVPTTYNETVPVNKGGTGQTFYTIGDILYANSTLSLGKLSCDTSIREYNDPAVLQQYYNDELAPARRSTSFAKLPKISEGTGVTITGHIYGSGTISFSGEAAGESMWDIYGTTKLMPKSSTVDVVMRANKHLLADSDNSSDIGTSTKCFRSGYFNNVYFGGGTTYAIYSTGNTQFKDTYQEKAHAKQYKIQNAYTVTKWVIETDASDNLVFLFDGIVRMKMHTNGDMEFFKS